MPYQRVIPRDLFNESKLLKCLGQVALLLHGDDHSGVSLHHDEPETGFVIDQDLSDGSLFCVNLHFICRGHDIPLKTSYNSRESYPLLAVIGEEEVPVLSESGQWSQDFLNAFLTIVEKPREAKKRDAKTREKGIRRG